MRIEARLNAIEKHRQEHADREVQAILKDLQQWSDAEVTAALKECMKQQPEYKDHPQEVDRLFLPENEREFINFLRSE